MVVVTFPEDKGAKNIVSDETVHCRCPEGPLFVCFMFFNYDFFLRRNIFSTTTVSKWRSSLSGQILIGGLCFFKQRIWSAPTPRLH